MVLDHQDDMGLGDHAVVRAMSLRGDTILIVLHSIILEFLKVKEQLSVNPRNLRERLQIRGLALGSGNDDGECRRHPSLVTGEL